MGPDVTLCYFDGCPSWQVVAEELDALAEELDLAVSHQRVDTPEAAEQLGFRGSPTVLVDGRDPFATGEEPTGLSCRVYATPQGLRGAPTRQQLREVLAGPDAASGER